MESRKLQLTIISAEEVKQLKWTGKMSPYAVAWIYPDHKVSTQVSQEGGKNPRWNETFELQVEERLLQDLKSTLTIEIYHDGPFGPKKLGVVNIPFTEVIKDWKEGSKDPQNMAYQIRRIKSGRTQGVLNLAVALGEKEELANGTSVPSLETADVETAVSRLTVDPPEEKVATVEKAVTDEKPAREQKKAEEPALPTYPAYPAIEQVVASEQKTEEPALPAQPAYPAYPAPAAPEQEKAVTDEKAASGKEAQKPATPAYPAPSGYTQGYPPVGYGYAVPYPVYAPVGYAQAYPSIPSPTSSPSPTGYPQSYAPPPGYPLAYPPPPGYPQGYPPPGYAQNYPPPAQVYPQGYAPQPYPVAYGAYPPPPPYYGAPPGQYSYPPQQSPKKSGFGGGGAGLGLGLGAGLLGGVLLGEALDNDGDCGDC